jgi:ParB/RepB/Spo0J family partition protein
MTQIIPLAQIVEVNNYRETYPADHIQALADSMKADGFKVEYAITVYLLPNGQYAINTGHCRTRAARLAGLTAIPCVILADSNPLTLKLAQLGENENRRDPDDISRARGFKAVLDAGGTIEQLSIATGKNKDYINRRLCLLALVPDIQELVSKGQLSIMYAVEIARLSDANFQRIALQAYNKLSHCDLDDLRKIVSDLYSKQAQANLFDNLPMWGAAYIEQTASEIVKEQKKSRQQLEIELAAERKARAADKAYAIREYQKLLRRVAELEKIASVKSGKVA